MDLRHIFGSLKFVRVLRKDNNAKNIFLLCKHNIQDVIVILQRQNISEEDGQEMINFKETEFTNLISNDIYHRFQLLTDNKLCKISTTLIYPATPKHIEKYSEPDELAMVRETSEEYREVVLPHLKASQFNLSWVYNLIEEDREKIVFRDSDPNTGFVMFPDLKWNQKDVNELYTLAICNRKDIMNLRDLRGEHLPLLENILWRGIEAIKDMYNFPGTRLRVYVHYQPTFHHFHVHFVSFKSGIMGYSVGKAHLLEDIIDNLKEDSDFYKKRSISYILSRDDPLFKAIEGFRKL